MKNYVFEIRCDDVGLTSVANPVSVSLDELDARTNPAATQTSSHDAARFGCVVGRDRDASSTPRESASKPQRPGFAIAGHAQRPNQTWRQR